MAPSQHRNSRQFSPDDGNTRKRVGKACDRCRLKKSKCDGLLPCQRCQADDQICVFSERKRAKDKTYPKGYVELLESRTQALADAIHRLVYCQQQNIDLSHILPSDGKIVLNDILSKLDTVKSVPEHVGNETYTDELLEKYLQEQTRNRQDSAMSDHSNTSDASSGEMDSPLMAPETLTPTFTPESLLSHTHDTKMAMFDQLPDLPTSISPTMLMPEYAFQNPPLTLSMDYGMSDEHYLADQGWY